jgi:prepilin-type N-terminal cleavage/methylation domain-containing protein
MVLERLMKGEYIMKKLKAFTLIECLIALFILGIASMLLCQGYTALMKITNRNAVMTSSLGQQMKEAESKGVATPINSTQQDFNIGPGTTKNDASLSSKKWNPNKGGKFTCKVSVYAVKGKRYTNTGGKPSDFGNNEFEYDNDKMISKDGKDGSDYRYAYFK